MHTSGILGLYIEGSLKEYILDSLKLLCRPGVVNHIWGTWIPPPPSPRLEVALAYFATAKWLLSKKVIQIYQEI